MKPAHIRLMQALKSGHDLEWIHPTPITALAARMLGRIIRPIPRFVSKI